MTRYRTIVADPPWPYQDWPVSTSPLAREAGWISSPGKRARLGIGYPTMTVSEIEELPIRDLADPAGCHVYLWTTNHYIRSSFCVLDAWGVRFGQVLTWAKTPRGIGPGGDFAQSSEFILTGRIGSLRCLSRQGATWFNWPRSNTHSRKPEAFLDMVEQVSPEPRLELFARRQRLGWDTWGDQALNHLEVGA